MMNRPQITPHQPANHHERERHLLTALRRQGFAIVSGMLRDERRGNVYQHPRVIEMERKP